MPIDRRSFIEFIGTVTALGGMQGWTGSALAQSYPAKPVQLIITFAPGGALDTVPRIIAQHANSSQGWTVVPDNRPGGGGQVGMVAAKRATPDGHTLVSVSGVTLGSQLAIKTEAELGYDPVKDFEPIILVADAPMVLLVRSDIPAKSVAEFVELLKKNPGKFNYGSGGFGTQHHLAAAMLFDQTGLPANVAAHVPNKGLALAMTDLLSGTVQFMISSAGPAWQHVQSGQLRALAVTSPKRLARLPELPTMVELGFRDFEIQAWTGLAAPAGTPKTIVSRWNEVANAALKDKEVQEKIAKFDYVAQGGTVAEFTDFVQRENARYKRLGKVTGLLGAK